MVFNIELICIVLPLYNYLCVCYPVVFFLYFYMCSLFCFCSKGNNFVFCVQAARRKEPPPPLSLERKNYKLAKLIKIVSGYYKFIILYIMHSFIMSFVLFFFFSFSSSIFIYSIVYI